MAEPGFPRWAAAVLGLVALVAPLVAPNDYWIGVMARICLYATLALGLNIVVGFAGLLDLGYVAFFGIGSYLYTFLASAHFGLHLPFLVTLPIVIVLTAGSGVLIGAPTLRLAGDYLAIVTLGFGEITYLLLINLDRPVNITGGPSRIVGIDPPAVAGAALLVSLPEVFRDLQRYRLLAFGLMLMVLMVFRPQGLLSFERKEASDD